MYIDSANISEIEYLYQLGIFEGVTTNPTLLLKEGIERLSQLNQILRIGIKKLFIQLEGDTAESLYNDFLFLREGISDNSRVALKVAVNFEGLLAIRKIKKEYPNVEILGTAIYSAEQMYVASLAGCSYVAPYINRMEVQGIDAIDVVSSARKFIDAHCLPCHIMGASFKNSYQVRKVYDVGIDTVTLSSDVIGQMIDKELANQAIDIFNQHAIDLKK